VVAGAFNFGRPLSDPDMGIDAGFAAQQPRGLAGLDNLDGISAVW
jgi:hypothetical protein